MILKKGLLFTKTDILQVKFKWLAYQSKCRAELENYSNMPNEHRQKRGFGMKQMTMYKVVLSHF